MVLKTKHTYHKRLFIMVLGFIWTLIFLFIGSQYLREKEYKSNFLNAELQIYNNKLLKVLENGLSYEDYINTNSQPFNKLRISIVSLDGNVIYDNMLKKEELDNHIKRPEIAEALEKGTAFRIGRLSSSDGREYFYSATKGENYIVRTAIPYSASLRKLLRADWTFIGIMIFISIIISIIAFFVTREIGKNISNKQKDEKNLIKKQLTNNINHELKTPVASIQVCLETLLSGIYLTEEKRQELIERCYMHNNRLRKLLDEVSLITRMEDGGQLINKEPVHINSIIDEIAEELNIMPKGERLNLNTNFSEEVIINGNISLIGSIFRNLTENAISYSGGKNIYITLLANNSKYCKICFEDDGTGVEEKQLSHLFERFYRVDKGRSRKMGGTGLGLAIVKHAVQFHGGKITVANRPNGGLSFTFTLHKK